MRIEIPDPDRGRAPAQGILSRSKTFCDGSGDGTAEAWGNCNGAKVNLNKAGAEGG